MHWRRELITSCHGWWDLRSTNVKLFCDKCVLDRIKLEPCVWRGWYGGNEFGLLHVTMATQDLDTVFTWCKGNCTLRGQLHSLSIILMLRHNCVFLDLKCDFKRTVPFVCYATILMIRQHCIFHDLKYDLNLRQDYVFIIGSK